MTKIYVEMPKEMGNVEYFIIDDITYYNIEYKDS